MNRVKEGEVGFRVLEEDGEAKEDEGGGGGEESEGREGFPGVDEGWGGGGGRKGW